MANHSKLRLAFMGTPDFAVVSLRALHEAGHDVVAVYTQVPKPSGRGQHVQKSPVHLAAEALGIVVYTPKTFRDGEVQNIFKDLTLDAAVVVAYGLILPQAVLDAPRLGCINMHFSLLPRWRGAAPVPRAIEAGDAETGICIMQMAAGLDTGDVLMCKAVPILSDATSASLLPELAVMGSGMILETLEELNAGTLLPQPQSEIGITYAAKLTREEGRIVWTKTADELERQNRALTPWPNMYFLIDGEVVKVLHAEKREHEQQPVGTLLDNQFTVACGKDALRLITVQRAGKKPTDGASLLRGMRLPLGYVFA